MDVRGRRGVDPRPGDGGAHAAGRRPESDARRATAVCVAAVGESGAEDRRAHLGGTGVRCRGEGQDHQGRGERGDGTGDGGHLVIVLPGGHVGVSLIWGDACATSHASIAPGHSTTRLAGAPDSARGRVPEPRARRRQHQRQPAVACAVRRPHGLVGEQLRVEDGQRADREHADELEADGRPGQPARGRADLGEAEGGGDVDQRGDRGQRVRERRLGGLGAQLDERAGGGGEGEDAVDRDEGAAGARPAWSS